MAGNHTVSLDVLRNAFFEFKGDNPDPYVVCELCGKELCTAEHKDSVGLIADVVADHVAGEHGL